MNTSKLLAQYFSKYWFCIRRHYIYKYNILKLAIQKYKIYMLYLRALRCHLSCKRISPVFLLSVLMFLLIAVKRLLPFYYRRVQKPPTLDGYSQLRDILGVHLIFKDPSYNPCLVKASNSKVIQNTQDVSPSARQELIYLPVVYPLPFQVVISRDFEILSKNIMTGNGQTSIPISIPNQDLTEIKIQNEH